jgi:hypothetical protein
MGRVAQKRGEKIGTGVDGGNVERGRGRRDVNAVRRAGSSAPIMERIL